MSENSWKDWQAKPGNPVLERILVCELGISPIMAILLVNRGICLTEEAQFYLADQELLYFDPFLLQDMDKAVARIRQAIEQQEKILIYGDYDADGITATVLLVRLLRKMGAEVDYFVPHRLNQGYGLHREVLQKIRQSGFGLIITVDCGISSAELLQELGEKKDLIITDHHDVPANWPQVAAVINPKRPDSRYPFRELCGVGVAFKLAQALLPEAASEFLDLVCIGTIADVVSLQEENRMLVKMGLKHLSDSLGMRALINVAGLHKEQFSSRDVAFSLAPRINAAGRVGDAEIAVRLLLSEDESEAALLAAQLQNFNQIRQKIESSVLADALSLLEIQPQAEIVILAARDWHLGVLGIVAAKLVKKLNLPVVLIAFNEDGLAKGSGRSLPGFHFYQALANCSQYLLEFGGHELAGGFSLRVENLAALEAALRQEAAGFVYRERLELDGWVDLEQINPALVRDLDLLAPLGHNNKEAVLGCRESSLLGLRAVGQEERHLKLLVKKAFRVVGGIAFNWGEKLELLKPQAQAMDLAFVPILNEWNEEIRLELSISDFRPACQAGEIASRFNAELREIVQFLAGSEAFWPGYLLECLAGFSSEFQAGLGALSLTATNWSANENDFSPLHWAELNYPPGALGSLCQPGSLVLASSPVRVIQLYFYGQKLGWPTAYWHRDLKDQKPDLSILEQGILIATPEIKKLDIPQAQRVIFYDLPYSPAELSGWLGEIWLLPPSKGTDLTLKLLNREKLLAVYAFLRQHSQINFQEIKEWKAEFLGLDELVLLEALIIFAELGLLQYQRGQQGFQIKLFSGLGKRNLQDSSFYCQIQDLKQQLKKWWKQLETWEA